MVQKLKQQEWWYWLVKEFAYNGLSEKELNDLSLEKLLAVFPARARRSLTRGINDNKRKLIKEMKKFLAMSVRLLSEQCLLIEDITMLKNLF